MIIFSIKLLNNLRKAIAGRRFPHQLAGGVALGVLLGIIPHGNLLALVVLLAVLCFRINHAMMGLVAILVSFGATRLDAYSHTVGEFLLTHPSSGGIAQQAWSLPLVPWTDLNNTVVLGSFAIGITAVLPIFGITLPIFRLIAPAEPDESPVSENGETEANETNQSQNDQRHDAEHSLPERHVIPDSIKPPVDQAGNDSKHSVSLFADKQQGILPPRFTSPKDESLQDGPKANPVAPTAPLPTNDQMVSVETRIDVIRMKDFSENETSSNPTSGTDADNETEQPMDEALNYLLHQLRHSQQRKAAG